MKSRGAAAGHRAVASLEEKGAGKAWSGPKGLVTEDITADHLGSYASCASCPLLSPIQQSRFDSDGRISTWNVCLHHTLFKVHRFYANGCWSKGVLFRFLFSLNHVSHSIRQRAYTFYSNSVFCKPTSCEILIGSYFKASLKGNAFLSCSHSI